MRIALLAPLRFPIREPYAGGLEAHTHTLARGLRDSGHTVTLFAHPGSDDTFEIIPFKAPAEGGLRRSWLAYRAALRAIAGRDFDLVHDNSIHWFPPAASSMMSCPVVTTLHTPPYRTHRWSSWLARRVEQHQYVSISNFLARRWEPYVGPAPTVHNGIALTHFPFAPAAAPNTAIWYGRITPDKGTHHAARAAQLAGFKLTIAGPIEDRAYFTQHVEPLLGVEITYGGHVRQEELTGLIGRASVGLVTPVWDEPFGLVCIEMLACGTPVAAFDGGAVREILTDEVAAIVPKGDVEALARVLRTVASKQRAACRTRAEDFSARQMVANYLQLYARVLT